MNINYVITIQYIFTKFEFTSKCCPRPNATFQKIISCPNSSQQMCCYTLLSSHNFLFRNKIWCYKLFSVITPNFIFKNKHLWEDTSLPMQK